MINTSNEYKKVMKGSRNYIVELRIQFADGTTMKVENDRIVNNSLKLEDAVSNNGSFDIGAAIINQLKVSLFNGDGYFDDYDFEGALIQPYIGIILSETTEYLRKGVFIVDEAVFANAVINLEALDMMTRFERPYSESRLVYPATLNEIVRDACDNCSVSLGTTRFDNDDYEVLNRPEDEALTFREVISYAAQIAGCFARCSNAGKLELKWYDFAAFEKMDALDGGTFKRDGDAAYYDGDTRDGGQFTESSSGDWADGGLFQNMGGYHHIYRINGKSINTDDVVITGIRVTVKSRNKTETDTDEEYLYGQEGYVLTVDDNEMIQEGQAQQVADYLGKKIVGIRFRPLTVSALADPSAEAGDIAYVSDMKGNSYQTVLTNVSFTMGGLEKYTCDAKSSQKNSAARYTSATKAVVEARRNAKSELDNYGKSVQQMNQLAANTLGFYYTEIRQEDGSVVTYRHDKPALQESRIIYKSGVDGFFISTDGGETYSSGFDKDGNAVMNILSVIGINADWIDAGSIEADRIQGGVLTLGGEHGFGVMRIVDESGKQIANMASYGMTISNLGLIQFMDADYKLKAIYNSYGASYYEEGRRLGQISTSYKIDNPEVKGLSFLMDMPGETMSWSAKMTEDQSDYTTLFEYFRKGSIKKEGVHYYVPVYTYNNVKLGEIDAVHSASYDNGFAGFEIQSGGFVVTKPLGGNRSDFIIEVTPNTTNFYTNSSKTIHCYNNLDIHGFSLVNQSDARLKKNIKDTNVKALDMLNQIELKEYDWIETGEHEPIGMIAQQLREIEENLVVENSDDGHLSIKETKLIPYLIKAVQELYEMQTESTGLKSKRLRKETMPQYTDEETRNFLRQMNKGSRQANVMKQKQERTYVEEE